MNSNNKEMGQDRNGSSQTDPDDSDALSQQELEDKLSQMHQSGGVSEDETSERLASPIGYVRKHGGLPATKKSLGQNWLVDPNVPHQLAELTGAGPDNLVLEVGPGGGALTEELLKTGAEVVTVEIDRRLVEVLTERWAEEKQLQVLHEDALQADFHEITAGRPYILTGNLPYNITSSLIFKLIDEFHDHPGQVKRVIVLLQYEAAVRIAAGPGESERSVLSVLLRLWGEPDLSMKVPREAFKPAPKVDAGVLTFDVHSEPSYPVQHWPTLVKVVKGTFAKRRKMLRNTLPLITGLAPLEGIEEAGFDLSRRPQSLSAEEYAWLANRLTPLKYRK